MLLLALHLSASEQIISLLVFSRHYCLLNWLKATYAKYPNISGFFSSTAFSVQTNAMKWYRVHIISGVGWTLVHRGLLPGQREAWAKPRHQLFRHFWWVFQQKLGWNHQKLGCHQQKLGGNQLTRNWRCDCIDLRSKLGGLNQPHMRFRQTNMGDWANNPGDFTKKWPKSPSPAGFTRLFASLGLSVSLVQPLIT